MLLQEACSELQRGFAFAAEHSGDLFPARLPSDLMQVGKRATAHDVLGYNEMRRRGRSDLGQVCDANNLMTTSQGLHLCANCMRNLAADVRIDLIEHKQRNRILH